MMAGKMTACEYCGMPYLAIATNDLRCSYCGFPPKTRFVVEEAVVPEDAAPVVKPNSLGAALRRLREMRKMSQFDLAKDAGINRSLISRWETGKWRPRTSSLQMVAKGLKLTSGQYHRLTDMEE